MKEHIVRIDELSSKTWIRGLQKDGKQSPKFFVTKESQYIYAGTAHMACENGWVKIIADQNNYVQSIEMLSL